MRGSIAHRLITLPKPPIKHYRQELPPLSGVVGPWIGPTDISSRGNIREKAWVYRLAAGIRHSVGREGQGSIVLPRDMQLLAEAEANLRV